MTWLPAGRVLHLVVPVVQFHQHVVGGLALIGTPIAARRVQAQGADRRLDAQGADQRLAAQGADRRRDADAAICSRGVG